MPNKFHQNCDVGSVEDYRVRQMSAGSGFKARVSVAQNLAQLLVVGYLNWHRQL